MSFLLAQDTIHGAAGKAFITVNGQVKELFGAKKIDAKANIAASDMKVIGTKRVQTKNGGAKMTGTGTMYYCTSEFVKMAAQYVHTGKMPKFNMQVTNDDKAASIGVQTVALYGCQLTGDIPITTLDDSTDMLTFDFSFSFEDFEILSEFKAPDELGSE